MDRRFFVLGCVALAGCGRPERRRERMRAGQPRYNAPLYPNETPQLRALIVKYANFYDVPVELVQRVIVRESRHRPQARNGPYYGLMQILPQTARTMGFRGAPEDLLDAETNLKYAVKYLRGAWLVSDGDQDRAVMWYARGYYYEAKRRGMLRETGLRS
ncbi:lytic transglycosylase domain-containing protein [Lutimaribacter saemankumensis]|uniref:Transglycosylase SLT domain-containing protein n=1 Tax=Lutimaribacter saemankumensis TaxID=490829 RepID=A0A1G8P052_9RHOB|nr:Transglycosylase SLT domain-containing protein [Lutimaribacter saemankumensis]